MISAFEYVTVLISIILGLGITQILTGIAGLFHKSEKVKLYWPHILWVGFVLILHIQEWWVTYELKNYQPWRLPTFLFIMLYPVNLFVLARMLFPTSLKGKRIDLKSFYLKNYRKIFLLFIASAILSVLYNLFMLHLGFETQILQFLLILTFTIVTIRQFQQEWVHKGLSLAVTLIMLISIVIERNVWLIN
jgi:hypothetical protein